MKIQETFRYLVAIFIVLLPIFGASADDSIPSTDLQEVTVVSDRAWIKNGVHNYLPTKKEKQLSNSAASLINVMNLPMLKADGDNISTLGGNSVSIFINGQPANSIDLSTFRTNDVKRVEYMENPSDPTFQGASNVVNFIMTEYQVGGVTKAELRHTFPIWSGPNLASKLIYKRMTFGAMVSYFDSKRKGELLDETQHYRDVWFGDTEYSLVERKFSERRTDKSRDVGATVNAVYRYKKFRATHAISLMWNQNPGSGGESSNIWSEDIFGSDFSSWHTKSRSLSPQISGSYSGWLNSKWYLGGGWKYAYARNHSFSESQFGLNPEVINNVTEKVNSEKANLVVSFRASKKWTFQLNADQSFDWYSTRYSGSATESMHQQRNEFNAGLMAYWTLSDQLVLMVQPGIYSSYTKAGDYSRTNIRPKVQAYARWNPNQKLDFSSHLSYYISPATASNNNPVLVKSSDLMWVMGNPGLLSANYWMAGLNASYLPLSWLSIGANVNYHRTQNDIIELYEPAPKEYGGLIRNYTNAKPFDFFQTAFSISTYFLNRTLSLSVKPSWTYQHARGAYAVKDQSFSGSASASYILGNFRFETLFTLPYTLYRDGGMKKEKHYDWWTFSVSYGYKDLYAMVKVIDLLHERQRDDTEFSSPFYSYESISRARGRCVYVTLSYTFGYGKQTDKSINVSGPDGINSSVITK